MTDMVVVDGSATATVVREAAAGDQAAFARLVVEHHASMARVAYVVCGDAEAARDAVQSAWVIAWRRLGTLRDPSLVRPWLVAIAANEARQAVRRGRRLRVVDITELELEDPGSAEASIRAVDLRRSLRHLTADDRALLAMRYVAGLDATEIAHHLGGTSSGVRSRLSRLLGRLRRDLDGPEGADHG